MATSSSPDYGKCVLVGAIAAVSSPAASDGRFKPLEASGEALLAEVRKMSLSAMTARACNLYLSSSHNTPRLLTKITRALRVNWAQKTRDFVTRETHPERVGAKTAKVAQAQDTMTVAVDLFGLDAVVKELGQQLVWQERTEDPDDSDESDAWL